jgi:hypothetical protein
MLARRFRAYFLVGRYLRYEPRCVSLLALTLLEAWVFLVDNVDPSLTTYNFVVWTALLD